MPSRDLFRVGPYGAATRVGSSQDATEYKSTKAAEAFYAALLNPEAKIIRRKSGAKHHKRQHKLVYNAKFSTIRHSELTDEMHLVTNPKTITSPDQQVHVLIPVLNARATFHAQTDYPAETYQIDGKPPVTMSQKRKEYQQANVEGTRRWNRHRDW